MLYIADLHVHSRYAKATSPALSLESLYQWAQAKGIAVIGTGDATHPAWLQELKTKLVPDGSGLFCLKQPPAAPALAGMRVRQQDTRFCLSAEINCQYYENGRQRQLHHLVYVPDFDILEKLNKQLAAKGNLAADGRPTIQLCSRDLLELVLSSSPRSHLVPAHVWTPWFSLFGSRVGYNRVEECFKDLAPAIFALETGFSSDPDMNRRCSWLDRYTLLSSSDAHSPHKLGREANLFDTALTYDDLFEAVKTKKGFLGTYEFFPEEGKYFHDGHRKCGIAFSPSQTARHQGICPRCGHALTIGSMNRLEQLADRPAPPPVATTGFEYIVPLPEILAELHQAAADSKKVQQAYVKAITAFGDEFSLLHAVPLEDVRRYHGPLAESLHRMRTRQVKRQAGYDGVYGSIRLTDAPAVPPAGGQLCIF